MLEPGETREHQRELNKELFRETFGVLNRDSNERYGGYMAATFDGRDNLGDLSIDGLVYDDGDSRDIGAIGDAPVSMKPPFICIDFAGYNPGQHLMSSSQGRFPVQVIGADNMLYNFVNVYSLNSDGEAAKLESNWKAGTVEETSGDANGIPILDFNPVDTRRHVELDNADYELIKRILQQIKDGEFLPQDS